jgi:hypothetical protein
MKKLSRLQLQVQQHIGDGCLSDCNHITSLNLTNLINMTSVGEEFCYCGTSDASTLEKNYMLTIIGITLP